MSKARSIYLPAFIFWVIFTCIALLSTYFAYYYFSKAFSIANINITMDRTEALQSAALLSQQYNWLPIKYRQYATFQTDSEIQNFIELDCGGADIFKTLLNNKYYTPYTWQVKHFKEYDASEITIFFTPNGTPFGFSQQLSETVAGSALSSQEARLIAENKARNGWDIDFSAYHLLETSQTIKANDSIDHTFIYELLQTPIPNASIRLTLMISGQELTQLKKSIKVPDTFKRSYEEKRSHNNIIALLALACIALLYILGGVLCLYFLKGPHFLILKWPLLCSALFTCLHVILFLNKLPLEWAEYKTALSIHTFIGTLLINTIISSTALFIAYTVIIAAAENLTRAAFPDHIQFWQIWTPHVRSTAAIAKSTIIGYFVAGIMLGMSVLTYYIGLHYCGWWSPTETLYDPNILAHYLPWLSPTIEALNAGFIEECLFRAIPLAGAAVLGNHFGKRNAWIMCAFILQAIIFGAAHANYPAQPSYARLIELMGPSFIFGWLYLRFGLLPVIISHFIFDIILMSLPIFLSTSSYLWVDKIFIILCSSTPLLVIMYAKHGKWGTVPSSAYNKNWSSSAPVNHPPYSHPEYEPVSFSFKKILSITSLGLMGLCAWIMLIPRSDDSLHLAITKSQALKQACSSFANQDNLTPFIRVITPALRKQNSSSTEPSSDEQHTFIWQTQGKDVYHHLLGNYLKPPVWNIRFLQFDGSPFQRAQEYDIEIAGGGIIIQKKHQLPELMPKASLDEPAARKQAYKELYDTYALEEKNVIEISAVPSMLPHRQDWIFSFKTLLAQPLSQGEARIVVTISGDAITNIYKYVYVPETWRRHYKAQVTIILIIKWMSLFFLGIVALCAVIYFLKRPKPLSFSYPVFISLIFFLCCKSLLLAFNMWPSTTASFVTAQPYTTQATAIIVYWIIVVIFKSVFFGLLAGFIKNWRTLHTAMPSIFAKLCIGIAMGTIGAAVYALINHVCPSLEPFWVDFSCAAHRQPFLSIVLINITSFIEYNLESLTLFLLIDHISHGWQQKKLIVAMLIMIGSILMIPLFIQQTFLFSIVTGICLSVSILTSYIFIFRFDRSIIPFCVGTIIIFQNLQFSMINAYPQALAGGLFDSLLIFLGALYASQLLLE